MSNEDRARPPRLGEMKRIAVTLVLFSGLAGFAPPARAVEDPGPIELRSGTVEGPGHDAGLPPSLRERRHDLAQGGAVLLKFSVPSSAAVRDQAARLGIRLTAPLGRDAYVAWLPAGVSKRLEMFRELAWWTPYHPGLRLAPELLAMTADDPREVVPITVHVFAHVDLDLVAERIESLGGHVRGRAEGRLAEGRIGERAGRLVLTPTPAELVAWREVIAGWPEVFWIGRRPHYGLLNDATLWAFQSGVRDADP